MKSVMAMVALGALVMAACTTFAEAASGRRSSGPVRFYDQYGNDRGYAWCRQRGGWGTMNPPDCSYYTFGQCQAASGPFGGNYCSPNPYAAQAAPRRRAR
jgi:hypothetical protein